MKRATESISIGTRCTATSNDIFVCRRPLLFGATILILWCMSFVPRGGVTAFSAGRLQTLLLLRPQRRRLRLFQTSTAIPRIIQSTANNRHSWRGASLLHSSSSLTVEDSLSVTIAPNMTSSLPNNNDTTTTNNNDKNNNDNSKARRTNDIVACAQHLQRGGLVAFPTETVYGLGADATRSSSIDAIFRAKGRPWL